MIIVSAVVLESAKYVFIGQIVSCTFETKLKSNQERIECAVVHGVLQGYISIRT